MPTPRTLIITMAMLLTSAGAHGEECLSQDIDAASHVRRDVALAYLSAVNSAQKQQQGARGKLRASERTDEHAKRTCRVRSETAHRSLELHRDAQGLLRRVRVCIYEARSVTLPGVDAGAPATSTQHRDERTRSRIDGNQARP